MSWKIKKKCRDLLAREEGYTQKLWGECLSVCLIYPNVYRVGMANLGFQTIYRLINQHPSALCERAFLPEPVDEIELTRLSFPLFSMESQRPIGDFDIVAFSIPFENDYPNILKILDLAGIPLAADCRTASAPLVIGGGISITLNPEPLADFFDVFFIGEAEPVLPEFLQTLIDWRPKGLSRRDLLCAVQKTTVGAYVPSLYTVSYREDSLLIENVRPADSSLPGRIKKRWAPDINDFETSQEIITADSEFGEMYVTEISRGCGRGCRFCAAGFVCRPVRFRRPDSLAPSFDRGIAWGKKIGLLGTAVSDHPDLPSLCRSILHRNGRLAIGSLRLDRLNDETVGLLKDAGVETVSLAPEAGSQRLRDILRKGITEDDIFNAVDCLIRHELLQVRLYFMVGLPGEADNDVDAIIDLVKRIQHRGIKISSGMRRFRRITVSLNQFIPKPATPFQWHPLEEVKAVQKKIRRIDQAFRKSGAVKVIHDVPKWNYVQALLSLGDRRVGKILLAVRKHDGNWSRAFRETNINPDFYVYRRKGIDEVLPWDMIDHGVSKAFLLREYKSALDEAGLDFEQEESP